MLGSSSSLSRLTRVRLQRAPAVCLHNEVWKCANLSRLTRALWQQPRLQEEGTVRISPASLGYDGTAASSAGQGKAEQGKAGQGKAGQGKCSNLSLQNLPPKCGWVFESLTPHLGTMAAITQLWAYLSVAGGFCGVRVSNALLWYNRSELGGGGRQQSHSNRIAIP